MKLEVREMTCGYKKDQPVIKNVTFDLQAGDICCILGPNGVGKSTLFKTILKLIPPLKGAVYINGENIEKWSAKRVAKTMAYVAQTHIPAFPYQVKEIAMFGRLGQVGRFASPSTLDYEIVNQSLEDVGIIHLKDKIYTDISGGERQLLMIAKALAQKPEILILDEPTANLDYGNMVMVLEKLNELAKKGLCIIFTTHNPDHAFMCNAKTVILVRNEPILFGEAASVVTESNLNRAYHADIQVLQVVGKDGGVIRICTPRFHYSMKED